jgi:hypothetical protein
MRNHWARVMVAGGLVLSVVGGPSDAGARPAGEDHLPDLQTLPPSDTRIDTSGGRKLLRFSNTVVNLGDGRLELRPENPSLLSSLLSTVGTSRIYQVIYTHDQAGGWAKARERFAGTAQFHSAHNHWHFEKFARYELYTVAADGSLGSSLNRVSEKTTFCVIDTTRVSTTIEHAEAQRYVLCGRNDVTGISVGWGDTYGYQLDGQWIDVAGLPNGNYWLVSTADYAQRIQESRENNNQAQLKIAISGNSVAPIG